MMNSSKDSVNATRAPATMQDQREGHTEERRRLPRAQVLRRLFDLIDRVVKLGPHDRGDKIIAKTTCEAMIVCSPSETLAKVKKEAG